jgi:asparaginyl-tRNA synthetase
MTPWVRIEELGAYVDREVQLRGWLYHSRSKGKIVFLLVRDGSGICQCVVVRGEVPDETFEAADRLGQESSLIVEGIVHADPRAPGGYELWVRRLQVLQATEGYPITPKPHGIDFLLDHRHLWLRSRRPFATLRIRHEIIRAIRDFLDGRGFLCLDAPILTPAACEGTTTLFEVQYFDDVAYLSQSGQLYVEAGALAFGRVYCFGPTFRAERSKTRRHLTEFWMVEPEVAFTTLEELMELAEDLVCYIVERVLERRRTELAILERDPTPLERVAKPFPRMTYDEAVQWLLDHGLPMTPGDDFGSPQETALSQAFDRPLIVHRYPAAVKAFYMEPDPERPDRVLCMDVLAPEGVGEIIGGSMRVWNYDLLLRRLRDHNLPEAAFRWYLDLRRYGSVPHGGFGLGLERTVAWICGLEHVREAIPFPRTIYRLYP